MILDKLLPSRSRAAVPAPDDDFWYAPLPSDVNGGVTPSTAIQVPAVMACVRVISETLAQLPLHLMRGRKKATDHPLYQLLRTRPNTRHTSFEFREMMQAHLCLRGNAFALKKMSRTGEIEGLVPLDPDRMQVFILSIVEDGMPSEGKLGFLYRDRNNIPYKITQDEMFRIAGLSFDGILGISIVNECKKSIELSSEAETHGTKFFKNAARPGGVIQFPKDEWLEDEEAHKRLKSSWRAAHTGDDLYSVAILEGGAEWKPMGLSNEDSEWLESRRFQESDIARIFRVPPHMIGLAIEHGNTYANVEQSDTDFVRHTMLPWFVRWEQAILRDLADDPELSVKFSLEGFLRADSKSRAEFYKKLRWLGVLDVNEIRDFEDMDPVEGGDVRHIPVNMVPLQMAGQTQSKPVEQRSEEPKEEPSPKQKDESQVITRWIGDAATRIHRAEVRDKASVTKETWIKRHRDYVWNAVFPIIGDGSAAVVESIVAGVNTNTNPSERYTEIVSIITKGASDG